MLILRILKEWTLLIAMLAGALAYVLLSQIPILSPLKPYALSTVKVLTPVLIFTMLFLTFCKINPKDLRPRLWHFWLLLLQSVGCISVTVYIVWNPLSIEHKIIWEGVLACLLCPTATAAAVVTGKMGGDTASLTSYTLASNVLSALLITTLCPFVEPTIGTDFMGALLKILTQVTQLLIAPFLAAWAIRVFLPKLHRSILQFKDLAFYLWGISLAMVMAQTLRIIVMDFKNPLLEVSMALATLVLCGLLFFLGKAIGHRYGQRISGGQAFGQKNTIFAIWLALTYLNPIAAVGPGSYVVWQNSVNSWQLWKKRKQQIKS
ncbi:MAG: transporter [Bacteroidaceae bacterium]